MILRILTSVFIFLGVSNCGFTVVNKDINYKIIKIETSGDARVNFLLKNKLLQTSASEKSYNINLKLNTLKEKTIKEKDISNKVTKYEIKLITKINYIIIKDNDVREFILSKKGFYDVSSKYSDTLNNEKNLIDLLIKDLTENILNYIAIDINDL